MYDWLIEILKYFKIESWPLLYMSDYRLPWGYKMHPVEKYLCHLFERNNSDDAVDKASTFHEKSSTKNLTGNCFYWPNIVVKKLK